MTIVFGFFWQEKQTSKEYLQYYSDLSCNTLNNALIQIFTLTIMIKTQSPEWTLNIHSTKVHLHWRKKTIRSLKVSFISSCKMNFYPFRVKVINITPDTNKLSKWSRFLSYKALTNCLVFSRWRISGCFVRLVFSSGLVWRLGAVNKVTTRWEGP